jgi:hypothetical protein
MRGNGNAWKHALVRTSSQGSVNSTSSFWFDDLQDIFEQAAAIHSASACSLPEARSKEHKYLQSVLTKKGSSTSGQITVPPMTLPEILINANKMYTNKMFGKPMPFLGFCLDSMSMSGIDDVLK